MKAHLVGTFAAIGALVGCGVSDPKDLGTLSFEIREFPDTTHTISMPIELVVGTEEQAPCLRYVLQRQVGFGTDRVIVDLTQTDLPETPCIPHTGPFQFSYPIGFGPVTTDNPFFLTFERAGSVDRYVVIVSDTTIDIAPLRSVFTHPTATHVVRGQ
jgi:hypothetical protein